MNAPPMRLKTSLRPFDVMTVPEMGWSGTKDKDLLDLAKTHLDIFITADQNLIYQQRIAKYPSLYIILQNRRRTDTIKKTLTPLVRALTTAGKGPADAVYFGKVQQQTPESLMQFVQRLNHASDYPKAEVNLSQRGQCCYSATHKSKDHLQ